MRNKFERMTRKNYLKSPQSEWDRLGGSPYHKLEHDTTFRYLKKHLPKKAKILDAGGGPGRYTIELAKAGHEMVLFDLLPEHLAIAKREASRAKVLKRISGFEEGTITDLSRFKTGTFDAVLCLGGPLSHVGPASQRTRTVAELVRVAKKGAVIFISVMSKYGVLLATPLGWPMEVARKEYFDHFLSTGDDMRWRRDGYCHFFTSAELRKICTRKDTKILGMAGLEGLNLLPQPSLDFAQKYPRAWKNWLDIHDRICTDPFVVDASSHMLAIVKKT
jgi:2-polyprenyl-3-methyl-5-hydroxy-6-metoxy-1,4-benzoquinol methylase